MEEKIILNFSKHFLENPYSEFYLREIAKKLKISVFSSKKYLDYFVKEKILTERRQANLRYFKLNLSSVFVRHLKISYSLKIIEDSGMIPYLLEKIPSISSIVLFGSVSRGEDDKKSDVDIVVIGRTDTVHLGLHEFEKKIGRSINEHVFSWTKWKKQMKENNAFYTDVIINGIPLYGELPLVQNGN